MNRDYYCRSIREEERAVIREARRLDEIEVNLDYEPPEFEEALVALHSAIVDLDDSGPGESVSEPTGRNITPEEEEVIKAALAWEEKAFGTYAPTSDPRSATGRLREALTVMRLYDNHRAKTNSDPEPEIIKPLVIDPDNPDYEEFVKAMNNLADQILDLGFDHISTYVMAEQHFQLSLAALKAAASHMQLTTYLVRRKE